MLCATYHEKLKANIFHFFPVRVQRRDSVQNSSMASNIGARSPSTSPRLPSPPPIPEVQIGLKSPTMSAASNVNSSGLSPPLNTLPDAAGTAKIDNGAMRRIRPGTRAAEMASGPPLVPLAEVSLHLMDQNRGPVF